MARETRPLPVPLTETEVNARRDQAASYVGQIEELLDAKKKAAADFKAKQQALEAALKKASKEVRARAEDREVEVEDVHDDIHYRVDTIRCDTGEVVASRDMTHDEKKEAGQGAFPGMGRKRKTKAAEA